jgi:hypothetical protein
MLYDLLTYIKYIFHVKSQRFFVGKVYQDTDPDGSELVGLHGSGSALM